MAEIIHEVTTVERACDGLLLIQRQRVFSDGAKLGGDFYCEASAALWLADRLEEAADLDSTIEQSISPDHFEVFTAGGQHYEETNVNVLNEREAGATRGGKTYSIGGLTKDAARHLAAELRALAR